MPQLIAQGTLCSFDDGLMSSSEFLSDAGIHPNPAQIGDFRWQGVHVVAGGEVQPEFRRTAPHHIGHVGRTLADVDQKHVGGQRLMPTGKLYPRTRIRDVAYGTGRGKCAVPIYDFPGEDRPPSGRSSFLGA